MHIRFCAGPGDAVQNVSVEEDLVHTMIPMKRDYEQYARVVSMMLST